MLRLIQRLYERMPPRDPGVWHKWNTLLLPVRCIDGQIVAGSVLRRINPDGSREYRRLPFDYEDWLDHQW